MFNICLEIVLCQGLNQSWKWHRSWSERNVIFVGTKQLANHNKCGWRRALNVRTSAFAFDFLAPVFTHCDFLPANKCRPTHLNKPGPYVQKPLFQQCSVGFSERICAEAGLMDLFVWQIHLICFGTNPLKMPIEQRKQCACLRQKKSCCLAKNKQPTAHTMLEPKSE